MPLAGDCRVVVSVTVHASGGAVLSYHAGDDSKLHSFSSPFSSAKTDRTESCLFLFLSFRRRLELLTSCSMLDDLPLVLGSILLDSACGRSDVGVSSCWTGDDHASEVFRLGVMLRLGKTRPWKPFFLNCSRRFARVVPGPARGDDLCSTSSMSSAGYGDAMTHKLLSFQDLLHGHVGLLQRKCRGRDKTP